MCIRDSPPTAASAIATFFAMLLNFSILPSWKSLNACIPLSVNHPTNKVVKASFNFSKNPFTFLNLSVCGFSFSTSSSGSSPASSNNSFLSNFLFSSNLIFSYSSSKVFFLSDFSSSTINF